MFQTDINRLLENMEMLYENLLNLTQAFAVAMNGNVNEDITVPIVTHDENGNRITRDVNIKSLTTIQNEITRVSNNFNSLTNRDNVSYILNEDGTISQYNRVTFANSEHIELSDISTIPSNAMCITDFNSVISDLMYPMVKIPVHINSKVVPYTTKVFCKSYEVTDGWNDISADVNYNDLNNLIKTGKVVAEERTRELDIVREQVKLYGKFTVNDIRKISDSKYAVRLNKLTYTGIEVSDDAFWLKVGDMLVSNTGNSSYIIDNIALSTNTVELRRIAGVEEPALGLDKLEYNQVIQSDSYIVGLPVKPIQKVIFFLSTQSYKAISFPSLGIKIDTTDYMVTYKDTQYTIDEFFSRYVANVSDYLINVIQENTIPARLGIRPNKPELIPSNFKVVQINKHTTDSKSVAEINKMNEQKQQLLNRVDFLEKKVVEIRKKLEIRDYANENEKETLIITIKKNNDEINQLNTQILTIARNIDNNKNIAAINQVRPKYKVVGYWHIQDNILSPNTGIQRIVKYDVQYRYLSTVTDESINTTLKMVDNGQVISVTFSPWISYQSETLQKVTRDDGTMTWYDRSLNNSDEIGINQCWIPISENESVEVRVRAVSEAGYPGNPVKSEWSNIVRVDFPDSLKENSLNAVISKNNIDLANAEFNRILEAKGLLTHITSQVQEGDKVYHHTANYITSGQFDNNMRIIPLDTCLRDMISDINSLKLAYRKVLNYSIIGFDGREVDIKDQDMVVLNAPAYNIKSLPAGSIHRSVAYIKIKNNSITPVELPEFTPSDEDYKDIPIVYESTGKATRQSNKQAIYFVGQQDLYERYNRLSIMNQFYGGWCDVTNPPQQDKEKAYVVLNVDSETEKYHVRYNPGTALYERINIVEPELKIYRGVLSTNIANVIVLNNNFNSGHAGKVNFWNKTLDLLNRYSFRFHTLDGSESNHRIPLMLGMVNSQNQDDLTPVNFTSTIPYALGNFSCGSFFYPRISTSIDLYQSGKRTIPAGGSLIIPLVFENRFTDAKGYVMGYRDGESKYITKDIKKFQRKLRIAYLDTSGSINTVNIVANCAITK